MGKLKTESPGFQGELTFPKHWFLSIKRSCPCLHRHWDQTQSDVCLLSMLILIILWTRSVAVTRVNLWKGLCGLSVDFLWTLRLFCFHVTVWSWNWRVLVATFCDEVAADHCVQNMNHYIFIIVLSLHHTGAPISLSSYQLSFSATLVYLSTSNYRMTKPGMVGLSS